MIIPELKRRTEFMDFRSQKFGLQPSQFNKFNQLLKMDLILLSKAIIVWIPIWLNN